MLSCNVPTARAGLETGLERATVTAAEADLAACDRQAGDCREHEQRSLVHRA